MGPPTDCLPDPRVGSHTIEIRLPHTQKGQRLLIILSDLAIAKCLTAPLTQVACLMKGVKEKSTKLHVGGRDGIPR